MFSLSSPGQIDGLGCMDGTCPSLGGSVFSLSSPGQTNEPSTWMAHVFHWEGMCSVCCSGANCQVFELRCTYDPVEQTAKLSNSDVRAIQQQLKIQDQPVDFMCTDTLFQHPLGYNWWPHMGRDTTWFCDSCIVCSRTKRAGREATPKRQHVEVPAPGTSIQVDLMGSIGSKHLKEIKAKKGEAPITC